MDIAEIRKKAKELDKAAPAQEKERAVSEDVASAVMQAEVQPMPKAAEPITETTPLDEVLLLEEPPAAAAETEEIIEDYLIDDELPQPVTTASVVDARAHEVSAGGGAAATVQVSTEAVSLTTEEAVAEETMPEEDEFLEAITFLLCGEVYAVDIQNVKEVVKPRVLTDVPRCPGAILGVFSLRGTIVPMMNLSCILKLDASMCSTSGNGESLRERIIIVRDGDELMAFKVDSIEQVVRVSRRSLELPPAMEASQAELISAIGRHGGTPFILLEIDKVMSRV